MFTLVHKSIGELPKSSPEKPVGLDVAKSLRLPTVKESPTMTKS